MEREKYRGRSWKERGDYRQGGRQRERFKGREGERESGRERRRGRERGLKSEGER